MLNKENKYTVYVASEECAEVSQILMKLLRFGIDERHPVTGKSNKDSMEEEIGQLRYCLDRIIREFGLDHVKIIKAYDKKGETWNTWKNYYDAL